MTRVQPTRKFRWY